MKRTFVIFFLLSSFSAIANLEHTEGQGSGPSNKNLTFSRACFQEILDQGCSHPREDRELFNNCLADKLTTLSPSCQTFFQRLYGKRN